MQDTDINGLSHMLKKFSRFLKLIPLLLVGVAVIVWASVFQRKEEHKDVQKPQNPEEPPLFPY